MKNIIKLSLVLLLLAQLSCGPWGDNIHFSENEFVFKAEGDSALVTTKSSSWLIVELKADSTRFTDFWHSYLDESYMIIWGDLTVEKRNNQTIFIKIAPNPFHQKRDFQIAVESFDYSGYINVSQLPLN